MLKRYIGLFLGIAAFIVIVLLPAPEGLSQEGMYTAAVVVLMSIWWITEAIPVYVTAFVPLVVYPSLKILTPAATASNYGHNYALMFLAVFFLAKAIETQQLHKRIALSIINFFGTDRKRIVLSTMIATVLVSFWIANVTTALMMLPIGMAIAAKDEQSGSEGGKNFSTALMLAIAYTSTIGGLGTLIATPTNMIFVGIYENLFPEAPPITFFMWLKVGIPVVLCFLPILWFFLIKYFKVEGSLGSNVSVIKDELQALGKITTGERRVLFVAALMVLGWVWKDDLALGSFTIPGWVGLIGLKGYIHDSTIAMAGALILFAMPDGKGNRLITWKEASQVPWGVVMIVGGGYALASGFVSSGLAGWLGGQLSFVEGLSTFFILAFVLAFVLFFTEFNSNTATANILLPVLASTAVAASINPLMLMLPATFACSCAFMMPAATGPNTVVLGSERVTVSQMMKAGFWLNLITFVLLTLIFYFFALPVLGLEPDLPTWAMPK